MFGKPFVMGFRESAFNLSQAEEPIPTTPEEQAPETQEEESSPIPTMAPGKQVPTITVIEGVTLLGGAALTVAGSLTKSELMKIPGELLLGASVFSLVLRHSST